MEQHVKFRFEDDERGETRHRSTRRRMVNDNSIPMISFHVVHDVPTRVRTHPQIRIPARDKREGDLQTNGSPYSNTNTAFVRTSIRHRTRTHRTARKKSSITARFRLLFPPFLSSPKLRFSTRFPSHSLSQFNAAHFNVPAELGFSQDEKSCTCKIYWPKK